MFKETHPILGTRDIQRAIAFYTQQLGFKLAFGDKADPPNYVGFRRDAVELHMQFQFEHEMGTIRLRFLVDDPDALFGEYRQQGVECNPPLRLRSQRTHVLPPSDKRGEGTADGGE
jgi:catechol 2,3-dioxygenase-like lactoylglutathione lyase family enzyme